MSGRIHSAAFPPPPQRLKITGFIRFNVTDQLHKNVKKSEIYMFDMHFANEMLFQLLSFYKCCIYNMLYLQKPCKIKMKSQVICDKHYDIFNLLEEFKLGNNCSLRGRYDVECQLS